MATIDLKPCRLADLGNIQCDYQSGTLASGHLVLIVSLKGSFRSAPNDSGGYELASALVMTGLEAWQPWAAILDLRLVEYEWGDRMQNVVSAPQRWSAPVQPIRNALTEQAADFQFPSVLIASATNRKALETLLEDEMGRNPREVVFDEIDEALGALEMQLRGIGVV